VLRNDYDRKNIGLLCGYSEALRVAGWTLECIGRELGVTRERVRQFQKQAHITDLQRVLDSPKNYPLPAIPLVAHEVPDVHVPTIPSDEAVRQLLELQPIAQKVRANSPKYRLEAEEYTALLYKVLVEEKVTVYQLAKALGITRHAVESRLVRYGYRTAGTAGTAGIKEYKPIRQENRVQV
jgi:hypothetical protein